MVLLADPTCIHFHYAHGFATQKLAHMGMDERESHCPYLLSSETTAKGTGLAESAGKEDPVELDSSLAR